MINSGLFTHLLIHTFTHCKYMTLLIIFFVFSIGFSFLCSILEAVLLSITPSYVSIKEQEGSPIAERLKAFKEDIDRPLSAILTLNTIAHTVGAIMVGKQAAKVFGDSELWQTVIAALMTLAILVLSEIIPKTIGANNWKALTPFTVKALGFLDFVLRPFIWLSQSITKTFKKEKDKSVLSRADFMAMTEIASTQGIFREGESNIMRNLLSFDKIRVGDVMTPRIVVVSASEDMTIQEFYDTGEMRFSRVPLYKETADNVTGYFLKDQLLMALIKDKGNEKLSTLRREIVMTNNDESIPTLFNRLMEKREHIALSVDQFGGTMGVVTIEDIVETLLGMEIVDEFDSVEDMQAHARKIWKVRAEKLGLPSE